MKCRSTRVTFLELYSLALIFASYCSAVYLLLLKGLICRMQGEMSCRGLFPFKCFLILGHRKKKKILSKHY